MSTKPHHDYASIAKDARQLHDVAIEDLTHKEFAAHVSKRELAALLANIEELQASTGGRGDRLAAQIAAGVHVAEIRASIAEACRSIHAAADLAFEKDAALRRAFGFGMNLDESSTASVELYGHALLAAAAAHPREASHAHLDSKGIYHLEDMLHALEGADIAHVTAKANRHDATMTLDSLAHLVASGAARIRFVAKRVFRSNEARLARYATSLPRHGVKHRTRLAPTSAGSPQ